MSDPETIIRQQLPKSWSKSKRDDLADAIVSALWEAGYPLDPDNVTEVEVSGARVPVERITAYGLQIEVDANGNAVTVRSPHGLVVTE